MSKRKNKILLSFLVIIITATIIGALYYVFTSSVKAPMENKQDAISMEKRYKGKIVYTSSLEEADKERLKRDCRERGGDFNECGDVCAPQAQMCAQVCAYTCVFSQDEDSGGVDDYKWETYKNEQLGFSIEYPASAIVNEKEGSMAEFLFFGPQQKKGTELYDGARLLVSKKTYSQDKSLEDFVKELTQTQPGLDIQIIKDVSIENKHDYAVYTFTRKTMAPYKHLIAFIKPGEIFDISYFISGNEYRGMVDKMLSSFEINDPEKVDGKIASEIITEHPKPGQSVSSPLRVSGQAKGSWFFEGRFPVLITNWDGLIIGEAMATTSADWMTEELVPFSASVEFNQKDEAVSKKAFLILRKANPSGLAKNDKALEYPVYIDNE